MRTCIGCGTTRPKKELIRIILTPEGEVQVDRTGRANGRGAYICDDPACAQKAARKKSLQKAFRTQISAEACERLAAALGGGTDAG